MKGIAKMMARAVSLLAVLPLYIVLVITGLFSKSDHSFQCCSQILSLFPGMAGNYLRREFYVLSLEECSGDCCIEFGTTLNQRSIEIGKRVYIGTNCCIGECKIEDDALIGSNVDIISGKRQHFFERMDIPIREQGGELDKIVVGKDSWIGNSSVVMANIGTKSIVGAGSVVSDDVPSFSIVAGNPARILRQRV